MPCHWERINTDEPYQVSVATSFLSFWVTLWQHERTCRVIVAAHPARTRHVRVQRGRPAVREDHGPSHQVHTEDPEFGFVGILLQVWHSVVSRMRSVRRLSKFEPGNGVIWLPLLRKKTQLRKVKRTLDIEERMLFHGTGHSNIQAICTFNFDWRLTGSHGDVYGKGTGPPPCEVTLLKTNILIVFVFFVVLFATSTHRKLLCPRCQVLQ